MAPPARLLAAAALLVALSACGGLGGHCPAPCTCKWKGGKQTVECTERGLITIPESVDAETQVLDLSGNNLQILPRETFVRSGLLNLQRVFLRSCRIGQIDDMALRALTNLIELDLSHNLLTAVPSGTFQDVPFLRDLVLAHNPIQKIDVHAFRAVPGLIKLDLSHCDIQTIASEAFEGIELLESLKLNGNRLSELRVHTVETLSRLHGVELHDNPWHCDCRLRPVKEWLVTHNIPYPIAPVCSGGPERVIHKTFTELHIDDFACKPEMLHVSRIVETTSGENATIVCRANAVPAALITWYWNGRPLLNNSAFSPHQKVHIFVEGKQEKRSTLVITNAHETDSGEFYCVAENRAGSAEANFTLHVSMRSVGISSLGGGQIAGLSAALLVLIVCVLLVRLRRMPFSESKTPGQIEVVTVVHGASIANGKAVATPAAAASEAAPFAERRPPPPVAAAERGHCANPVQKPPRLSDAPPGGSGAVMLPASCFASPSNGGNNPDLINDTRAGEPPEPADRCYAPVRLPDRPASGEYSRNTDSLYPSGLWGSEEGDGPRHLSAANAGFHYDDKTPIIGGMGSAEELSFRSVSTAYPPDYGLPIAEQKPAGALAQGGGAAGAKTLRVWQRGGVPVLPPVTALKRVLANSRSSPDEGYQEGCGTDV